MIRLGDMEYRCCFFLMDRRAKIIAAMADNGVPPSEVLECRMHARSGPIFAMVSDPVRVPLRPRGGLRPMRDEYNSHTPMTIILPKVWLGSWWAASQLSMLKANGTEIILSRILFYSLK